MHKLIELQRYATLVIAAALTVICLIIGFWASWVYIPAAIFGALTLLGLRDVSQSRHAVLKNYPILGHIRFLFGGSFARCTPGCARRPVGYGAGSLD